MLRTGNPADHIDTDAPIFDTLASTRLLCGTGGATLVLAQLLDIYAALNGWSPLPGYRRAGGHDEPAWIRTIAIHRSSEFRSVFDLARSRPSSRSTSTSTVQQVPTANSTQYSSLNALAPAMRRVRYRR